MSDGLLLRWQGGGIEPMSASFAPSVNKYDLPCWMLRTASSYAVLCSAVHVRTHVCFGLVGPEVLHGKSGNLRASTLSIFVR